MSIFVYINYLHIPLMSIFELAHLTHLSHVTHATHGGAEDWKASLSVFAFLCLPFSLVCVTPHKVQSQVSGWDGAILRVYDECRTRTHGVNSHEDEHRGGLMILTAEGELIVNAYHDVRNNCWLVSKFLSIHGGGIVFGNSVTGKQGVSNPATWSRRTTASFATPFLDREKIQRLLFSNEEYWNCENPSRWGMARIFQCDVKLDGRAVASKNKWTSDLYVSGHPWPASKSHFIQLSFHNFPLVTHVKGLGHVNQYQYNRQSMSGEATSQSGKLWGLLWIILGILTCIAAFIVLDLICDEGGLLRLIAYFLIATLCFVLTHSAIWRGLGYLENQPVRELALLLA